MSQILNDIALIPYSLFSNDYQILNWLKLTYIWLFFNSKIQAGVCLVGEKTKIQGGFQLPSPLILLSKLYESRDGTEPGSARFWLGSLFWKLCSGLAR